MEGIISIIIIIFVLFFLYHFNAPQFRGAIGESRVARKLAQLPYEEYKVLNDVLIRTQSGTSQIDHIVVSVYGIFVIETKNYGGWIHGNENSEYWTQTFYKKKTKFRNPVKQNWSHIYALKEILSEYDHAAYHPIVVFAGRGELKNVYSQVPVLYHDQLLRTLTDTERTPVLSIGQVRNIADRLNEVVVRDAQAKKEHVLQVRDHAREKKQKENSRECPWCGGNVVVREGPYGMFYGCSKFPKCKYKQKY